MATEEQVAVCAPSEISHSQCSYQSKKQIPNSPVVYSYHQLTRRVILTIHMLGIPIALTIFISLFFIRYLIPFLLVYLIGILFSNAGCSGSLSRRSQRFRHCRIWTIFASYFPAQLHRSVELLETRKYIFGYHPHGIICHGAFMAFGTEALGFSQLFPGITNTLLTLDSNFRIPLYREYILSLGLGGVSRSSCKKILSQGGPDGKGMGRAITIVIGGARESLLATPETMRLIVRDRKGFVTLAVQQGADLVPVLGLGENNLYDQRDTSEEHPRLLKVQLLLKQVFGWTMPMFHGRGLLGKWPGLLPYQRPLDIVVGRPVEVEQQDNPEEEYVDLIHRRYMDEIERLWDEWKDVYGGKRASKLEFL